MLAKSEKIPRKRSLWLLGKLLLKALIDIRLQGVLALERCLPAFFVLGNFKLELHCSTVTTRKTTPRSLGWASFGPYSFNQLPLTVRYPISGRVKSGRSVWSLRSLTTLNSRKGSLMLLPPLSLTLSRRMSASFDINVSFQV